jgi:hypothetical protein
MEAAFLWMLVRRDLVEMLLRIAYVLIRVKLFLPANLEIHLGLRGAFPFNGQTAN